MTITHTGRLRLAPGVFLSAVVCTVVAVNLIHRVLSMLNASPR